MSCMWSWKEISQGASANPHGHATTRPAGWHHSFTPNHYVVVGVKLHEMRYMGATAAILKAAILDPTLEL